MSPRMPGLEAWLVTGSQHLYGQDVLERVGEHARAIAALPRRGARVPVTDRRQAGRHDARRHRRGAARGGRSPDCVGVIAWMHTFSPAKMWIAGLTRPAQAAGPPAHAVQPRSPVGGDRHGLHEPPPVRARRPGVRVHPDAAAARPQDGRRPLAGPAGHGAARLVAAGRGRLARVAPAPDRAVRRQHARGRGHRRRQGRGAGPARVLGQRLRRRPTSSSASRRSPRPRSTGWSTRTPPTTTSRRRCARAATATRSCGRRRGSRAGCGRSWTTAGSARSPTRSRTWARSRSCPGIGVQRLMADGYGFGAEGDWKAAALVRILKVDGRRGCRAAPRSWRTTPTTWATRSPRCSVRTCSRSARRSPPESPSCEIHPLSIGGRADPVRLVFDAAPGPGVVVGLADLGDRFRLIANEVDVVEPDAPLPRLPVARAVWRPRPDLPTAAEAWLTAGGPHHTALTTSAGDRGDRRTSPRWPASSW